MEGTYQRVVRSYRRRDKGFVAGKDRGVMADDEATGQPTTAPLATLATITVYERLVTEKEAEIAALRAEVERLTRHMQSQQTALRQAQAMIAYLSEQVAEQGGRPAVAA